MIKLDSDRLKNWVSTSHRMAAFLHWNLILEKLMFERILEWKRRILQERRILQDSITNLVCIISGDQRKISRTVKECDFSGTDRLWCRVKEERCTDTINALDSTSNGKDCTCKSASQRRAILVEESISSDITEAGTGLNSSCRSNRSLKIEQDAIAYDFGGKTFRTSQASEGNRVLGGSKPKFVDRNHIPRSFIEKKKEKIQYQGKNIEAPTRIDQWIWVIVIILNLAVLSESWQCMDEKRSSAGKVILLLKTERNFLSLELGNWHVTERNTGSLRYLQNQDYPSAVRAADTNSYYHCSLETNSCSSHVNVYFIYFIHDGSNSGTGTLQIVIADKETLKKFSCVNKSELTIKCTLMSTSNYLIIRLEKNIGINDGCFWIGFEAYVRNIRLEQCCNGVPNKIFITTGEEDHRCCGTEFISVKHECCNGKKMEPEFACCGFRAVYSKNTLQSCCRDQVYNRHLQVWRSGSSVIMYSIFRTRSDHSDCCWKTQQSHNKYTENGVAGRTRLKPCPYCSKTLFSTFCEKKSDPPKERPELYGTGSQFWSGVQLVFCDNENGTARNCCKGRNKTDLRRTLLKDEQMVGYPNDAKVRNKTAEWNAFRHQHWDCIDAFCLLAIILVCIRPKARESVSKGNSSCSSLFARRALLLASLMYQVDGNYAGSAHFQQNLGFRRSQCVECNEICDPTIVKMRCDAFCENYCSGECITLGLCLALGLVLIYIIATTVFAVVIHTHLRESSGDYRDQEVDECTAPNMGHQRFKEHINNYSQSDMIREEGSIRGDVQSAKASHFATNKCNSSEVFQQPHLVPQHSQPELVPDKVTRHSPDPKIFTSITERVEDELTDRTESNVNDMTFEVKASSFSVSIRPLYSDDEDELFEDVYTSSAHTSICIREEEVSEMGDESFYRILVGDKIDPQESNTGEKTIFRIRDQEDEDTANAVDKTIHIHDHAMSKQNGEDDDAETDDMILDTFGHSSSSNRVSQKNHIKGERFHMIRMEEEIPHIKRESIVNRRYRCPPLSNHSLDRNSFNDSLVQRRHKKEDDDDCNILRSITWLPLDDLPVPDIYTCITVHSAAQVILNRIASGETIGAQESMKFEILRVCTYRNYPSEDKPFRILFSSAGMYYASDRDEVVCYSCGLRKSGWKEADSPLEVHKQIKPSCDFFVKNADVNIRIPELEREQLLKFKSLDDLLNSSTRSPLDRTQLGDERTAGNHGNFDLNTSESQPYRFFAPPPKHPQYAVQSVRLESFKGWPTNIPQTATIMAECGYYYAGFGDCVRCFHCGIGLRHWTEEDYPWVEHARWSKDCAYLRQMKGEEFIQNVHLAIEEDEEPEDLIPATPTGQPADMSQVTPNEDSNQILLTDPAQSVLEMGYQPRTIKKAIDIILRTEGRSGISAMKIMEKIFMLEERSNNLEQGVANMNISGAGVNTEVQSQNSSGTDQTQNVGRSQVPNTGTGQQAQSCSTTNQSQRNEGLPLTQNSSTSQAQGNTASGQNSKSNISHTQSITDNESPAQRGTNVKSTDTMQAKATTKRPLTTEKQNEAAASPKSSPHSSLEGKVKGATSGTSQSLKDTTKIKAENQKLKEQTICKVCLDKPVSIVFLPCGHLVTCAECAPAMKKCPICRALVKGSVKAFMS